MKQKLSSEEWVKEFEEFLSADEMQPPQRVTDQILSRVRQDLNPGKFAVFSKLALIHTLVGTLTLLFCPYSELYTFKSGNLMNVLMRFGEQVCMLGCGAVFLGGSALMASLVLRSEEVQVIRKARLLQLSVVALLSMTVFVCTGLLFLEGLAVFWALGSVLGGLVTLELGWAFRNWMKSAYVAH